jgi:Ca-activated chloride channel family protein
MDFRNPHFADPEWLLLALLAPLGLIALHAWAARARENQLLRFAAIERLDELLQSHSPAKRVFKNLMLVLAVAAAAVALARPQWGQTTEMSTALGEDIVFIIDCSKSMLSTDAAPNRLARAKFAILDFVQKHGRGRVGLVAFAGQAFLQCPLTFDYDAFRESLQAVDETTIPVPGTDIGSALDEAFHAMEKNDRHKVMVLLTDGEDLEQTGVKTAQKLGDKGVVVYCVGVGTAAGSNIQIINDNGVASPMRDRQGDIVQSRLDETTLRKIAEATHGSYQPLGTVGEGLGRIRQLVENSPHTSDLTSARKLGVDRFYIPVGLATLLLFVESLIGTRRKIRHIEV